MYLFIPKQVIGYNQFHIGVKVNKTSFKSLFVIERVFNHWVIMPNTYNCPLYLYDSFDVGDSVFTRKLYEDLTRIYEQERTLQEYIIDLYDSSKMGDFIPATESSIRKTDFFISEDFGEHKTQRKFNIVSHPDNVYLYLSVESFFYYWLLKETFKYKQCSRILPITKEQMSNILEFKPLELIRERQFIQNMVYRIIAYALPEEQRKSIVRQLTIYQNETQE